jgi:glycerol-3-phosphate dehydrogenase (NAD(P)+)
MADGLGTGDNTRAAVITRGLHELTSLGMAMGGDPLTFAGLAGMGDLVATCISVQSRNRYVGEQLGRGRSLDDIVAEMDQVAEGVKAVPVVKELGDELGLDLPIVNEVYRVVVDGQPASEAYRGLLRRKVGRETRSQPVR